jgi:hypothetical protein
VNIPAFLLIFFLATTACAESELSQASVQEESPAATISGQIMINDNTPMPYGIILLYDSRTGPPPSLGKYWRVPDLITSLEKDGKFSLEVTEGKYYIQAAQKNPDAEIGPATEKEYFYFHGDADRNALPIEVSNGSRVNLGKLRAFLWSPDMVQRDKGITAVEGVVVDTAGKPVEKAIVLAYYNSESQGRPVFISDRTDQKGSYQLRVNDGGVYFLKVRSVVGGGEPVSGEYLNTTKEFEPVMVTLKKNEKLKGITLKVMLFTRPTEEPGIIEKRDWKLLEK